MGDAALEFGDVFVEDMGVLNSGRIKLGEHQIIFKNEKTGKVTTIGSDDIKKIDWQRLGNKPGLKVALEDGDKWRFGGFKENDFEKIKTFSSRHWKKEVEQPDFALKGWNYGKCDIDGKYLEFNVDSRPVFEVPLSNVSNCVANKYEATLEFHQIDECPTSLIEMRFHMPADPADGDDAETRVEEFRQAVMQFAGIETDSGQPVASLSQILCTTPRGRYDIKVFPNHLSLHGKTYDYKIPVKTIMRLFLVPHKDGRHVFFVISLNPPIRQGQTRYHYLVLEFLKEEEIELELGLTEQQLADQYGGKLEKEMNGPLYEVVSKIFRVLVNMKITVPGHFIGHSGTPAVQCAFKQASGFLYPLEKGFLYVHKPPMYIRFEEITSVHFARSDGSTRSFDFEIEMKNGNTLTFNSVEKDEYNKLYDYVENKHLRIRNAKKMNRYAEDSFAGSDDEIDPYKETVKAEGKERAAESSSDSEDEDYDLDDDLSKRRKEREDNSSEGSASEPDEEYDSDADSVDGSGSGSGEEDEEERPKKKPKKEKSAKTVKEPKERKQKEGKRAKKDPNAPKRAQSAYFLWMNENRSKIKKDGDSVAETSKRAGEMWKALTDSDKAPYDKKALEEKKRYEEEMKEYKKSGGAASSSAGSSSKPKKSSGPSPAKAKSKEYISDSDDSEDEKPKEKSKEKTKEKAVKKEKSESEETTDSD